MSKFFELFTNSDGRASTTGFIQFFGFLVMAGVLIYAVYLDRSTVTDLFFYFACSAFCSNRFCSLADIIYPPFCRVFQ